MTANDFIGGFSLGMKEILDISKEELATKWYNVLDKKREKEHNEVILANDEVKKVQETNIHYTLQATPPPQYTKLDYVHVVHVVHVCDKMEANLPPKLILKRCLRFIKCDRL